MAQTRVDLLAALLELDGAVTVLQSKQGRDRDGFTFVARGRIARARTTIESALERLQNEEGTSR